MIFARFDEIIDREPAVRHLGDRRAAAIVEKSLRHFNGDRYDLIAFVVMPSHFHWVFHPREEWVQACLRESRVPQGFVGQTSMSARGVTPTSPRAACPIERTARERIMQSIKGYTARECNKLLGLSGTFWQDESYDHVVRDHEELLRIIEYIEHNPVKAGLVLRREDWKYSSACERIRRRIPCGEALPRG
ncbi:MAG: transposase [Planctomycetaceae bacterium]